VSEAGLLARDHFNTGKTGRKDFFAANAGLVTSFVVHPAQMPDQLCPSG